MINVLYLFNRAEKLFFLSRGSMTEIHVRVKDTPCIEGNVKISCSLKINLEILG